MAIFRFKVLADRKWPPLTTQQRERNSMDTTSPDLRFLLDANLIHALSDVYLSLFPQIRTVGPIAERSLDCLFKTMLCIFEEHGPGHSHEPKNHFRIPGSHEKLPFTL
jgi:hypothetical protein